MGTIMPREKAQEMVGELESVAEEIRLKLHLASMDAKTRWDETLEPKLFEARTLAREASDASVRSIEDALEAFRTFAKSL